MSATKIYVISDLHLGQASQEGVQRRKFCSQSHLLANFLRQVADQPRCSVELVINGDFVDFLLPQASGQPAFVADRDKALERIQKIVEQEEPDVFRALQSVSERQTLRVLLGNHDLELRLPQVQDYLAKQLGCGPAGLWLQSQPYTPMGAVIVHGNQYDGWNKVDYEALDRYANWCKKREGAAPPFEPPPGSRLVVDVINPLKTRYPFVDLLKPEVESVIPLLLALEPEYIARLPGSAKLINSELVKKVGSLLLTAKLQQIDLYGHVRMGGISASDEPAPISISEDQLELAMASAVQAMGEDGAVDFIRSLYGPLASTPGASQAEISFGTTIRQIPGLLGLFRLRKSESEAYEERLTLLGKALRPLRRDPAFQKDVEDSTLLRAATNHADHYNARFVVFGHTHLAKRVPLSAGKDGAERFYLNSGTWADLFKIPDGIFDSNWVRAENCLRQFVESWLPAGNCDPPQVTPPSIIHYVMLQRPAEKAIESAELYEFTRSTDRIA